MKKTKQQEKLDNRLQSAVVQKDSVLHLTAEKQVPFLYVAMKEPSDEYKKAGESKKRLYRFIKVK